MLTEYYFVHHLLILFVEKTDSHLQLAEPADRLAAEVAAPVRTSAAVDRAGNVHGAIISGRGWSVAGWGSSGGS
jgi:hypothetical protein